MEPVVEIKNRTVVIETSSHKEGYCKAAMLFYVIDGSVTFTYDNHSAALNRPDILVINRGTDYRYDGSDDLILASLELMGKTFESACDGVMRTVDCSSAHSNPDRIAELRSILGRMISNQEYAGEKGNDYLVFEYYSLYYRLLEMIVAFFLPERGSIPGEKEQGNRDAARKEWIEHYLNIHYAEPVSLEDISRELFLSKGYLSKFFTQNFGVKFSQYLKELRLKHAMSDLYYSDKSITQISFDNGFASSSFFNRSFREKYGSNPSEVRRDFLEGEKQRKRSEEEEANLKERINRLLSADLTPVNTLIQQKNFSFSVQDNEPLRHCWNKVINIGSASDILKTDIQEHLLYLNETIHFQYARFWNPFSKEMLLELNKIQGNYNFARLDQVFDILLANGMKPFILFEPKIDRVNEGSQQSIIRERYETIIINLKTWEDAISSFIRHIVRKYGIREVEQWIFELSFEVYQIQGMELVESYLEMFRTMSDIVHTYAPRLKIGGPLLTSINRRNLRDLRLILQGLQQRSSLPDFVSMFSFAYDFDEERDHYSVRSRDESYLLHDILRYRQVMTELGLEGIPLYVTEWNQTVSDRNYINDSCYRGAHMIQSMVESSPYIEMAGFFCGTDRRADYYDSRGLLQGGNGLVSRDGILKPAGSSLGMMNHLMEFKVAARDHFLITTDKQDNYSILAHNKRNLSYYYYKTEESSIEKDKLNRYFEDESFLEQDLELKDVRNGKYQIRTYRVNARFGSVLHIWKQLGFDEILSPRDIRYIQRTCQPQLERDIIEVSDHRIHLKWTMEPNEFLLMVIRCVLD